MKKILLPVSLLLAGIICLVVPHFISSGKGDIDLKIQPASVIMPAAYKVYANPDVAGGRFNLFKAILKNNGKSEIKNLKVQFRIPKYIDEWTDVPSTKNLLPGQTAVVTCFPSFPQSITDKNTSSKEHTEIKVTYGNQSKPAEKDESFTFDMTSVNDMLYSNGNDKDYLSYEYANNSAMNACFVSAEDPIIKHYAQAIQNKILCGQVTDQLQQIKRTMEGVYNATYISNMVYSMTSDAVTKYGDNTTLTQHIRLPREVVSGNTGLCIELALLHASIYKAIGLHPVIFLTSDHAVPAVKIDNGKGGYDYMAIESTGIGGVGIGGSMNCEQAYQSGLKEIDSFLHQIRNGNPYFQILDIDALYDEGYKDMELKEDPILAKEVDKIIDKWPDCLLTAVSEQRQNQKNQVQVNNRNDGNNNGNNEDNTVSMVRRQGYITFLYPRNWSVINNPEAQLPILATAISSPDHASAIEIYHLDAETPAEAMEYIQQSLNHLGVNVKYSAAGQRNGMVEYTGTSYGSGGTYNWIGYFRSVTEGVEAVIIGSKGSKTQTIQEIINSVN